MMDQNVFAGQEVNEWLLLHAQLQSGSCIHNKRGKKKEKKSAVKCVHSAVSLPA